MLRGDQFLGRCKLEHQRGEADATRAARRAQAKRAEGPEFVAAKERKQAAYLAKRENSWLKGLRPSVQGAMLVESGCLVCCSLVVSGCRIMSGIGFFQTESHAGS